MSISINQQHDCGHDALNAVAPFNWRGRSALTQPNFSPWSISNKTVSKPAKFGGFGSVFDKKPRFWFQFQNRHSTTLKRKSQMIPWQQILDE